MEELEAPMRRFRGRVLRPQDGGYAARALLELDLRAAVGAVLNKRAWWVKWDDGDDAADDTERAASIRETWLGELERQLLTNVFQREAVGWRPWWVEDAIPHVYAGFPADASDDEKRAFVDKVCSTIPYNWIWHRDECKQISRGTDVAVAVERIESESLEEFGRRNASMQPYGQLAWYFELVLLNQTLRKSSVSEWQPPQRVRVGSKHGVARAIQLMFAVRRGDVTKDTLATFAPDGDHRAMVVDALWVHVNRIVKELDEMRNAIFRSLERLIVDHELDTQPVVAFISPGPVQETWISDLLIDAELKRTFAAYVAALESVPEDQKDWHPGSNDQVLDLVHPSLYCCVFGKTKRTAALAESTHTASLGALEYTQRMLFSGSQLVETARRGEAQYQWIPSDFEVTPDGSVKIVSYINNLHPQKYRGLYDAIARIFQAFVPLFDRVLSCLLNATGPRPEMQYDAHWRSVDMIPDHPPIPWSLGLDEAGPPYSLCGSTVQAIVKIAEIHLTPENPTYPGGAWHVEGSDAEQIVATGIYYFGCDNITESKLSFRVIVKEPEYRQDDTLGMRVMYGLARNERLVQSLGSVTALEDRCVVFPNTLQHRVEPFELADKTKPGVRKILAFFLVDPTKQIPSTAVIPPQQADWIREGVASMVFEPLQDLGATPEGVVGETVETMLGTSHGMTLEEAKTHRLALMAERTLSADDDRSNDSLFFSLCEH